MKRLWIFAALVFCLASCSNSTGYLCIGNGDGSSYTYQCDGDLGEMRETETIMLENLNTSLGIQVDVTMTVSTELGSVQVTLSSDGDEIADVVNAGVPLTLTGTAFLDVPTDSENRRITVTFEPLGSEYQGRAPVNHLHWTLELHPSG